MTSGKNTRRAVRGFDFTPLDHETGRDLFRGRTLEVSKVIKYGKEEFRPENETAEGFARLLRQKGLTREDIEIIKTLGHRVILKGGEL